jgi:hypothetical protein
MDLDELNHPRIVQGLQIQHNVKGNGRGSQRQHPAGGAIGSDEAIGSIA